MPFRLEKNGNVGATVEVEMDETGKMRKAQIIAIEPQVNLASRNMTVRAMLENSASFFGAQMAAMDSATRNAGEMIDKLKLRPGFSLHSLNGAEGFYKRLEMTPLPAHTKDGMLFFELSEAGVAKLLKAQ